MTTWIAALGWAAFAIIGTVSVAMACDWFIGRYVYCAICNRAVKQCRCMEVSE